MTITCFLISGICLFAAGLMFWGQWKLIKEEPWMLLFLIPLLILSALPIFMHFKFQDTEPQEPTIQLKAKPFNPADMTDPRAQYFYNRYIQSMIWGK